jgi:primosomal protein N' (replication factor Y) (superfamily II helicase)
VRHDFEMFARGELPIRESRDYPPFANMIRLVVRGPAERPTALFADELATRLRAVLETSEFRWRVLGPAPAPIAKLRGNFRFQIQSQATDALALGRAVRQASADLKPTDGIQWIADVDPLDML